MDANYFDQAEFAENPEPRCPVVLALDTSGSMQGNAIAEMNEALRAFAAALRSDRLASLRVEVAVIAFGGKVRAIDVRGPAPVDSQGQEIVPFNRFGLAIITLAALAFALFAGPIHAAAEGNSPPKTQKREQLTIAPEEAM